VLGAEGEVELPVVILLVHSVTSNQINVSIINKHSHTILNTTTYFLIS